MTTPLTPRQEKVQQLRQKASLRTDTAQFVARLLQELATITPLDKPEVTTQHILDLIYTQFQVSHVVLLVKEQEDLEIYASKTNIFNQPILLSTTILNLVFSSGQPFFSADAINDPRLSQAGSVSNLNIHAVAAVPLLTKHSIIGVLYVAGHGQDSLLKEDNIPYLEATASQAAHSLHNAWLHAEDKILLSQRQQIRDHISTSTLLSPEQLLPIRLGTYLKRRRQDLGLTLREVQALSEQVIDLAWLSRAERGDVSDKLHTQLSRLLILSQIYGIPAEIPMALAGIHLSIPTNPDLAWLEDILQDPALLAGLHKFKDLSPAAKDRVSAMFNFACDWLKPE